jgi:hypothetical protein
LGMVCTSGKVVSDLKLYAASRNLHSLLLPPNFSLINWVEEAVLLRLNRRGREKKSENRREEREKSALF